ncbi:hypothetical protein CBOM_07432 [Ceraceosorus bombacis]|uniref:Uncharacterized protein n=1 Tax=Ceraceosorus bombacis TaxID=401625 RepID=A0A0P1BDK7_9BASI|nr:hypothetical protein CBOM_07432 [Ceraceosorus bombacis]
MLVEHSTEFFECVSAKFVQGCFDTDGARSGPELVPASRQDSSLHVVPDFVAKRMFPFGSLRGACVHFN